MLARVNARLYHHAKKCDETVRRGMDMDEAKNLVKQQYGSVGDAYVRSKGHASGNDLERMVELATLNGSESMLDIATGGGHVVHWFAPHVHEVIASDLTPEILNHAEAAFENWGLTNVSTAVADAEDLPFDDARFDVVTCRIAPHHFPNPREFVREVARVLRPGGQFLLVDSTVPEGDAGQFFNTFEKIRDHSHVRSLTIAEWSGLIGDAGLELRHTGNFPKRHDFADWVARSRTSEADIERLGELVQAATDSQRSKFAFETDGASITSFTDKKTLFHAVKLKRESR